MDSGIDNNSRFGDRGSGLKDVKKWRTPRVKNRNTRSWVSLRPKPLTLNTLDESCDGRLVLIRGLG